MFRRKYQGEDNPEMVIYRGRGIFKEQWFSICSAHQNGDKDCPRCRAGYWHNVCMNKCEHVFYKLFPKLWMLWMNRNNSPSRKRLKNWFPNLR